MSDETVAFIGTTRLTEPEAKALFHLGHQLSRVGELHTAQMTGACQAVLNGYRAGGRKAVIHTSGLHDASPWFLIYGPDSFVDGILARWPNPKDTRGWQHLPDLAALEKFNTALATAIDRYIASQVPA